MRADLEVNGRGSKKSFRLLVTCLILVVIALSSQIIRHAGTRRAIKPNAKIVLDEALANGLFSKYKSDHFAPEIEKIRKSSNTNLSLKLIEIPKDEVEHATKESIKEIQPTIELQESEKPDWKKYNHVEHGQNCSAEFKWFSKTSNRSITAISSFPGSGNTWARHLLHMASGYWTGNRRSSNHLKSAGWFAEDNDCRDRTTLAQKTHRLSKNKACGFEKGLVLIRNPFDAILAAYNHHKAGKTGEPPMSVFEADEWPQFIQSYAMRWRIFHLEWLKRFDGPIQISCFENLVKNPINEVGNWLDFLDLDRRRVGCINADRTGQFYRQKTMDYSHLYTPDLAALVHTHISNISAMLTERSMEDCTEYFNYDKCC